MAACVIAAAPAACGKKGPPLPPVVHVPDAVKQVTLRRVGDDVFVTVTLPTQNVDGSVPVDVSRVDVYGYTGRSSPPAARFTEVARLVGTISTKDVTTPTATLRDTLTPDELVAGPPVGRGRGAGPASATATAPGVETLPLKRFYQAIPFEDRRPGPPSTLVELGLARAPDAPVDLRVAYTEATATVTWSPPGGLLGYLMDRAPPATASPLDDGALAVEVGTLPPGPTRFNVYREITSISDATATNTADTTPTEAAPQPVSASSVGGFTYTEPLQVDGRPRCYRVTALRGAGDRVVEGRASEPVCFTPVDTFPPAAPTGLSPIAIEGAINLVWEANTETDLGGYVVLRGQAGGDALVPLTGDVIAETRYTDRTVSPGVRYIYAVRAADRQPEPNLSAESSPVEVTAR